MKYTIPKGRPFYCEFVIKEPGASVPLDITGATGKFTLSKIGKRPCLVLEKAMQVIDGKNGIIAVDLDVGDTIDLESAKGFPEDGYPLMATYSISLAIDAFQPINVTIPKVYISDEGLPCQAVTP